MSEKLEPCPFCNGKMQERHALHISDGNTDSIIHAELTTCGLVEFDIGTHDHGVSVAKAWNRRSPSPAVEGGWRDIESVPRNLSRFLVWDKHYGVRVGRVHMRADHDDWLSYVDAHGNSSKGGIRATHWQPLPAPPAGEKP